MNKLTSHTTLLPKDYYSFPFCRPEGGPVLEHENLGEFLIGDRIESSPFRIRMLEDMYCQQVCVEKVGSVPNEKFKDKVHKLILQNYHNNWFVDGLPAASKIENKDYVSLEYTQGFPVGFVDETDPKTGIYIYNHVNIELTYHESDAGNYRIVGFTVEPFSIHHTFEFIDKDKANAANDDDDNNRAKDESKIEVDADANNQFKVVDILYPIDSCDAKKDKIHTDFQMLANSQVKPQLAGGKVLFTYDVIWKENKNLLWASRWDIYLQMGYSQTQNKKIMRVHWLSIANSSIFVILLSAMLVSVLVRNLRRDLARYNRLATDEEKTEELEEYGWKLVHADVFRPPSKPLLLAVSVGTGIQILLMLFFSIVFSIVGFLSPVKRGSLLVAQIVLYVLLGSVAGYITARIYKTFKGKSWQYATIATAFGFPGICFLVFFILNIVAKVQNSTDAVPIQYMILLLFLWLGISTPLVFFGAYLGFKQDPVTFPVTTSNIPRQIPDQPWFMNSLFVFVMAGLLPFISCFFELYFIMSSIWMEKYYYIFGLLFVVFLILLITCCETTILFTYFQLCGEDYHWWWRSFCTSGSVAFYIWVYSFKYFNSLHTSSFATYFLYHSYMTLASLAMFLMTGAIGMLTTLWFNKVIYSSVKID